MFLKKSVSRSEIQSLFFPKGSVWVTARGRDIPLGLKETDILECQRFENGVLYPSVTGLVWFQGPCRIRSLD